MAFSYYLYTEMAVIATYPDLYPGELFHHGCARYADRMQFNSRRIQAGNLFGDSRAIVAVDLPCYLDEFQRRLPPDHSYTSDYIIRYHTLFSYYSPFRTIEQVEAAKVRMKGNNGVGIHALMGIANSRINTPFVFRYCPQCVIEDRSQLGETYWHRLHQLAGVNVCPLHKAFLEATTQPLGSHRKQGALVTAENVIGEDISTRYINEESIEGLRLLWLSHSTSQLLEMQNVNFDLQQLKERYIVCLNDRGIAGPRGYVDLEKAKASFTSFYSEDLLQSLGCSVYQGAHTNWLARIFRDNNERPHPLCHLLVMHWLGFDLESIQRAPNKINPFGTGPWPCLNPVCTQFKQLAIQEVRITFDSSLLRGTFRCICGFTYRRIGPDKNDNDRYRVGRVRDYGELWENELRRLWVETISVSVQGVTVEGNKRGAGWPAQ